MRAFNKKIFEFLNRKDFKKNLHLIHDFPTQKTINTLFSFLSSTDKLIKENAIIAMAEIVSQKAESDIDTARDTMRRLTWSLNEESGWIGWGSAEVMGEIMARNEQLAEEFHEILISYISEGDNYLHFEDLRKEVILGLKRLAKVRPELVPNISQILK
jgi:HEAT repeat protein